MAAGLGVAGPTPNSFWRSPGPMGSGSKIRLTPGSVSITTGVWPDPVTSIEPVYWGVGSELFAYLRTQHRDGEQQHPTAAFVKDLVQHPGRVLGFDDARHWSERTIIMLCSQTTDTSIELYWDEGRLRSRHGAGAVPAARIPVVEKFVARLAEKMGSGEGALLFESISLGALRWRDPDRRQSRQQCRRPLPARVRLAPGPLPTDRSRRRAGG